MVQRGALVWLGVRTDAFPETAAFYEEVLGVPPYRADEQSVRFRLADGTEAHVYGPRDADHRFFGTAPVVGFLVHDVDEVRARLEARGLEFVTDIERARGAVWCHLRAPDGNVYEIMSRNATADGR